MSVIQERKTTYQTFSDSNKSKLHTNVQIKDGFESHA